VVLNPETFGVSPIPIVEDMVGEYICGNASILTEPGIGTGQTPVSTEHVDEGTSGDFFGAESTQPAVMRSMERVIRMQMYATVRDDAFLFFSRMVFLL
jgi:hypothetical protein